MNATEAENTFHAIHFLKSSKFTDLDNAISFVKSSLKLSSDDCEVSIEHNGEKVELNKNFRENSEKVLAGLVILKKQNFKFTEKDMSEANENDQLELNMPITRETFKRIKIDLADNYNKLLKIKREMKQETKEERKRLREIELPFKNEIEKVNEEILQNVGVILRVESGDLKIKD